LPKGDVVLVLGNQKAFLMKMLLNMINKPDYLWCKVLYSKYGRNNDLRVVITSQAYDSPLGKGLAGIWDQVKRHTIWLVGDGQEINFWLDSCLMSLSYEFIDSADH